MICLIYLKVVLNLRISLSFLTNNSFLVKEYILGEITSLLFAKDNKSIDCKHVTSHNHYIGY